jgi:small-conductance mechanosensitive channel
LHSVDEINVKELHQELSLISNQLHQNGDSIKGMIDDLNNRKEELVKFISQKNTELQQIASQLQTAQTNSNQISQLLTSSTSTNEKINGLLNQQNQHLEEQKKKADAHNSYLQKQTEAFSKLEADLNASIAIFEEKKVQFDQQLAFVESKKAFFEERNAYLEELIGREVGASLFETFKQRKNELKQPVRMWLWIVGAATLLSFVAIMAIFTNFFGLYGNIQSAFKWENIVVNALKCLPFFFFLYYSIFQYNKERNFQEEYAFKSAAALTIKAYSDILTGPENKDELVLNAVYKVYNSPIGDKNMNVKDVSNILDMIKDIVNKGSNFVTKK